MYHCHTRFCLLGGPCQAFGVFRSMPPLPNFFYDFSEHSLSGSVEAISSADVLFAYLPHMDSRDAEAAAELSSRKKEGAQLILLTKGGEIGPLSPQTL